MKRCLPSVSLKERDQVTTDRDKTGIALESHSRTCHQMVRTALRR